MGAVKVAREEHSDARGNNHLMELMEEQTVKKKEMVNTKTQTRDGEIS